VSIVLRVNNRVMACDAMAQWLRLCVVLALAVHAFSGSTSARRVNDRDSQIRATHLPRTPEVRQIFRRVSISQIANLNGRDVY